MSLLNKVKKNRISSFIIIVFFAVFAFLLFSIGSKSASALGQPSCSIENCDCGDCPCPTPTIIETECTPSPTPTQAPEPTVTPISEEPTPTPTEAPVPTASPAPERGVGGPVGPPICEAETPDAPYLISATAVGGNQVKIIWEKVEKATHYTVSYGPSSGNYPWGVPDTGDTDNFTIGGLSSGCFVVRAVNDCAPSDPSNEVCTSEMVGQVLGLSTTSSGGAVNPLNFFAGLSLLFLGTKNLTREFSKRRS